VFDEGGGGGRGGRTEVMGFAASVDALRSTSECISETRERGESGRFVGRKERKKASNEILNSDASSPEVW